MQIRESLCSTQECYPVPFSVGVRSEFFSIYHRRRLNYLLYVFESTGQQNHKTFIQLIQNIVKITSIPSNQRHFIPIRPVWLAGLWVMLVHPFYDVPLLTTHFLYAMQSSPKQRGQESVELAKKFHTLKNNVYSLY